MKKYRVKVNGKTFNVVLEAVEEVEGTISVEKKDTANKIEEVNTDTANVLAPIQGVVLNVLAQKGQKVKKGDVLLIIEAMKLENEVNAPNDCEIIEIFVDKGQTVTSNQPLIKIK